MKHAGHALLLRSRLAVLPLTHGEIRLLQQKQFARTRRTLELPLDISGQWDAPAAP